MLYRKIEKEIKEHLENNANTIGASHDTLHLQK